MRKGWMFVALFAAAMWLVPTQIVRAEDKEENEGKETKVKIADVPAAVKKTLDEESHGAKIETVDKEEGDGGKVIYEADAVINGKNYEIKVDPDGTLIVKKLDMEDEKGGKDKKDEKGEKDEKDEKEKK